MSAVAAGGLEIYKSTQLTRWDAQATLEKPSEKGRVKDFYCTFNFCSSNDRRTSDRMKKQETTDNPHDNKQYHTSPLELGKSHQCLLLVDLDIDVTVDGVVPATVFTVSYDAHDRPEKTYRT
jgi:hypothetical protein